MGLAAVGLGLILLSAAVFVPGSTIPVHDVAHIAVRSESDQFQSDALRFEKVSQTPTSGQSVVVAMYEVTIESDRGPAGLSKVLLRPIWQRRQLKTRPLSGGVIESPLHDFQKHRTEIDRKAAEFARASASVASFYNIEILWPDVAVNAFRVVGSLSFLSGVIVLTKSYAAFSRSLIRRSERRCIDCGYECAGSKCPECGAQMHRRTGRDAG